jgi:hypothetical protein
MAENPTKLPVATDDGRLRDEAGTDLRQHPLTLCAKRLRYLWQPHISDLGLRAYPLFSARLLPEPQLGSSHTAVER